MGWSKRDKEKYPMRITSEVINRLELLRAKGHKNITPYDLTGEVTHRVDMYERLEQEGILRDGKIAKGNKHIKSRVPKIFNLIKRGGSFL